MHPVLQRVLTQFDEPCAIIGSAACNFDAAHDIDVLFLLGDIGWKALMRKLKLKYNGWDHPRLGYHVRRANYRLPGVAKPIQLLTMSHIKEFEDYEYCCVIRDGTVLKPGQYFKKESSGKRHSYSVR